MLIYFQLFLLIFQSVSAIDNVTTTATTTTISTSEVLSTVSTYLADSLTTLMAQTSLSASTSTSTVSSAITMEIISINILPKLGNSVEVVWGKKIDEYNLNWTYGIYYGFNLDEALDGPKLTTTDLNIVVNDLSFCSKYYFAVGVVNANNKISLSSSRNVRSIGTCIDERAAPVNLIVEFLPGEYPCLLIKWSASCSNIVLPLGYLITIYEKNPARMILITEPKTTNVELSHIFHVNYGLSYDIKVSTDLPKANSTTTVSFLVPHFLQPYKLRLTSHPDGTFMMYWREPYVPYYIGRYYYEIYVYKGIDLKIGYYEKFQTNKSIFLYKGNESEYTFMVGLITADGAYRSYLTNPITKSVRGSESVTVKVT